MRRTDSYLANFIGHWIAVLIYVGVFGVASGQYFDMGSIMWFGTITFLSVQLIGFILLVLIGLISD